MPAVYPQTLPSFTTKRDQLDVSWAADVNRLQDEAVAVATELGTNPRGTHDSVKARLDHLQGSKSDTDHLHDDRYVRRSLVTSKGHMLVGTGVGNLAPIGPGSNGQVAVVDGEQPTGWRVRALGHAELSGSGTGHPHPQYVLATDFSSIIGNLNFDSRYVQISQHTKSVHDALSLGHGSLSNLGNNDHPQYPRHASAATITGQWNYNTRPRVNGHSVLSSPQSAVVYVQSAAPSGPATNDLWIRV